MKDQTFHVIGGGIAGLASAIAIANSGNRAIVLEKAARFEAVGAGLQLGPNAVRALQSLGAWEAVAPITSSPPEIHIRDGRNGKLLKQIELGQKFEQHFGMPYRVAHRADLVAALLAVAQSKTAISIQTNTEVTNFSAFENVIAADGVWSKTREQLFPATAAVVTNEIFHRALLAEPIGIANDCVNLWLYPGGHVVHYPVGQPAKLNLVAITQGADVKTHFANACDDLKQILALPNDWQQWPAAYVPKLQRWNKGNITLIGDAAHGTLPYLAQGAAMALEDAAAFEDRLVNSANVADAFQHFSSLRKARTNRVHQRSLRTGKIYHLTNPWPGVRNIFIKNLPSQISLKSLNWLYAE
jgi:salicylate hydroxylase